MFVDAIEKVANFTRPVYMISRKYGSEKIIPGAATLFFVNELGHAITCKHVALALSQSTAVNEKYNKFKEERDKLPKSNKYNRKLKELQRQYGYDDSVTIELQNLFMDCIDTIGKDTAVFFHPTEDVAVIKFEGFEKLLYTDYAIFLKNGGEIKQGKTLCRLGYPFPEFQNFEYDKATDSIKWTDSKKGTPRFPIDGMVTRFILNNEGQQTGIEMSTPGLRGQSGGPLFDSNGIIYGMQSQTRHLHLGFDLKDFEIFDFDMGKLKKVTNSPFLHLGHCIHVDVIKSFLKEKEIKFYESE